MNNRSKKYFRLLKSFDRNSPLNAPANFSTFYEQTHLSVFRYLYGLMGGSQEDVEDLTAETFIRAWRARSSFQGEEQAALCWIMKIARRLVIDNYRRRKARPETAGEISDDLPQAGPQPEEIVLIGEEQQLLWSLLQMLPEEQREVLTLRYLLGWQVKEIAAYLEVTEDSISIAIHRSLERLRQRWPQQKEN